MSEIINRVIVITGASAGVGRAVAQEFAKRGDCLGLIARGREKLESTLKEVQELGGRAIAIQADVSNELELENAAIEIEKVFGPIDIWVNNAMVTMLGSVNEISSSEIKRVMDVNYMGSVNGILVANRRFLPRDRGHIIQIGSALSYISIPLQSAYCASKHAVHGFVQSFRIELKANKQKIKISEVHLPAVNTPQFEWMKNHTNKHPMPVPPIFQPELMAQAVAYIADHPRKELWVCWPSIKAILGVKLAPWLAEWKLAKDGINSQQTLRAPVTNVDNMWKPITRDYGARGIFSDVAKDSSVMLWMDMHRSYVFFLIIFILVVSLSSL